MVNGFSKAEIRQVAKQMGLSIHDKPALACLASRIPFNQQITVEKLSRNDSAEQAVKVITGVKLVRVRDHDGLARIEVGKDEKILLCHVGVQDKINNELRKLGFKYVTFNLEGYQTGSMLRTLDK